ncbi:MAG TPA: isoleucine--tRNA ligase [Anaerolineaceae bacterium]|nr:isoleucine--tRNA ligase [Anaerolineaceae bacterium]HQL92874.1 isoleucine--tRNA ligase [Anaerolineaceae bacterium]
MFKAVSSKLDSVALEEAQLKFWKEKEIFKKSSDCRRDRKPFVMYEGPPTANGKPGIHHVIGRVYKDMFPRYKTMRGYWVDRRGGWDTHGLPVEIEVEKKLGFTNKSQIEAYGIDKFNELCKESAFTYIQEWERITERIAYWVDFDRAYITYKNEYIESVWWLLKTIWEKDLLYQGYKVVPYCPRCGTPLSDHEVSQGYADTEDPSITVRMKVLDEENTWLLVWTTTPWTLPSNVAVAAHPEVDYALVSTVARPEERYYLAKELIPQVFGEEELTVHKTVPGSALEGKRYEPLFKFMPLKKDAHYIVNAEYVTTSDGTGLVHIAPAFGMDDMEVSKVYDLPVLITVNDDGKFVDEVEPWAGQFVKHADPDIIKNLFDRGLMVKSERMTHNYPFCWRCKTPLLYMARPSWFIRTTAVRDRLVEINQDINWIPEHIKDGRFGKWLENNIDWAIGRNRYWATPLPMWICEDCGHEHCVGSLDELSQLTGEDQSELDMHRPYVDDIHFACPECKTGRMSRVPEVIDVWFDSGAMPVAQWHYPFEHTDEFKGQYPADFICEAIDQTRGWFYSLLAISTLVFDSTCYENVICYGHILDGEGKKMSKHVGNVVNPWDVINKHGADATRWYMYTASPPANSRNFSIELVGEVLRTFTLTLWNTYSFFVTYANLDNWKPGSGEVAVYSDLDKWLLSSLESLVREVTEGFDNYDVIAATRPIEAFVDQLSNWYLRRSRRRFWKSGADADKMAAYETLYKALVTLSKLLAPTMPFLAEELYQNLVVSVDENAFESVHLADWPEYDESLIDTKLNYDMSVVMKLASLGHAARAKSSVKVRQPLSEAAFAVGSADETDVVDKFADILEDELNVKSVSLLTTSDDALSYRLNPLPKQLGQKYKGLSPKIRQAILALPARESAERFLSGQSVTVSVDGQNYDIEPDEVEVITESRAGYEVAADGAYLAALITTLTPELISEGMAREVVRRVQALRKDAGLDIADRIRLTYAASPRLAEAIEANRDYITSETLALELESSENPQGLASAEDRFDEQDIIIALEKVERE